MARQWLVYAGSAESPLSPAFRTTHARRRRSTSVGFEDVAARAIRVSIALVAALVTGWLVATRHQPDQGLHPVGLVAAMVPWLPWLAALIAALAVIRPWAGLVGYVAVAPLIQVAQAGSYLSDLGIAPAGSFLGDIQVIVPALVVASVAVGTILDALGRPRARVDLRTVVLRWLAPFVLVAISLVSTAGAPSAKDAVPVEVNGILVPIVAAALTVALRPSTRQLWQLLGAIGVSAVAGSAVNLYEMFHLGISIHAFQINRILFARLTYYNVGIAGHVLAASLPVTVAIGFAVWRRGWAARGIVSIAVAIEAIALAGTLTKSAWLGCAVAIVVLLLALLRTRRQRLAIVLGVAALAFFIVPYPVQVMSRLNVPGASAVVRAIASVQGNERYNSWDPTTVAGEISIMERLYATQAAVDMSIDHPLVGVGPGQFGAAYQNVYKPASATRALGSAHDFLAGVGAELGLVAAAIVVLVLAGAFAAAWRTLRSSTGSTRALAAGLLTGLLAWLITAETFDVDLYRFWRYMDFDVLIGALLVGAAFALRQTARHGTEAPTE